MSLLHYLRIAQIVAGEAAVEASLRSAGLLPDVVDTSTPDSGTVTGTTRSALLDSVEIGLNSIKDSPALVLDASVIEANTITANRLPEVTWLHHWISVEDELPSTETGSDPVLFYSPDLRNMVPMTSGIYRYGKWHSGGMTFSNVTHWMPLPPPPMKE